MKIAIIIRKLNVKGGAQRQALCLALELKKRGHKIKFYTLAYDKEKCFSDILDNFEVVSLESAPQQHEGIFGYFSLLAAENREAKKLALLIDEDTELLHPHDQVAYKAAYYFKKLIKNIPSVWMMNDAPSKIISHIVAEDLGVAHKLPFWKKIFYKCIDWLDLKFIKAQDKIVVLDNRDRDWSREFYNKDAIVVRSGSDLGKFAYASRGNLPVKIKILLTGIFLPHRRFEDAILAAEILRNERVDFVMDIIGGYDEKDKYYQKIRRLIDDKDLVDRVKLLGRVSDDELVKSYSTHDVFLFPNHMQSWGIAVFEAMACGTPVIVSKTAGASEVLTNGENALIVNPKVPEELADAIKRLAGDFNFYAKISESGRKFVEQNIYWEKYADNMLTIFREASKISNF